MRTLFSRSLSSLGSLCALALSGSALAHGDLHLQIEDITRKIAAGAPKPSKLAGWHLERAELYRAHGQHREAEADLDRAATLDPELHEVDLARGRLWLDAGQPARAQAPLARFLDRFTDHPEALFTQAQTLARLGWGERAAGYLDRAIARHPQPEPDHYVARADILISLGEAQYPLAIRGLDEGCKRLGSITQLETRALELEIELGRHRSALARIDRLAKSSRRKDLWLARKAEVLQAAGRLSAAAAARRQALALIDALPSALRQKQDARESKRKMLSQLGEGTPRRSPHTR